MIAAETDPTVAARIWEEAESEGILVNVLDDADHCSFVAGSVVRQGPLTLAISTSGCAPALAVRLRQRVGEAGGRRAGEHLANRQAGDPRGVRYCREAPALFRHLRLRVGMRREQVKRPGQRGGALREWHPTDLGGSNGGGPGEKRPQRNHQNPRPFSGGGFSRNRVLI